MSEDRLLSLVVLASEHDLSCKQVMTLLQNHVYRKARKLLLFWLHAAAVNVTIYHIFVNKFINIAARACTLNTAYMKKSIL